MSVGTIDAMGDAVVGAGLYSPSEVEELLHISGDLLARITLPGPKGSGPPLVPPAGLWHFDFREFVSIAVVVAIRRRGVRYEQILAARERLAHKYDTQWPFAHKVALEELCTSGSDLLLGIDQLETPDGQQVLEEVARIYLRRLTFEGDHAARWEPADGVALDSRIQAGAPCVVGTRVPTAVIADLVDQGQPPAVVAEDLDLDEDQVRKALEFEEQVPLGLLAAA